MGWWRSSAQMVSLPLFVVVVFSSSLLGVMAFPLSRQSPLVSVFFSSSFLDILPIGMLSSFMCMVQDMRRKSQGLQRISAPFSSLTPIFLLLCQQRHLPTAPLPRMWANFFSSGIVADALKSTCVVAPFWANLAVKIVAAPSGLLLERSTPWLGSCAPSSMAEEEISPSLIIPLLIQIHVIRRSSRIGLKPPSRSSEPPT